jgi:hypothetical protein
MAHEDVARLILLKSVWSATDQSSRFTLAKPEALSYAPHFIMGQ